MSATPNWNDVASFTAEYLRRRRSGELDPAASARFAGNLLEEITAAYMQERQLPESARVDVLAMVDSVL